MKRIFGNGLLRALLAATILAVTPFSSFAATVSNLDFTPDSPAFLDFGDFVNFDFDYDTMGEDVFIFGRPFTGGALSPSYAAHPSPLYNGVGSDSGFFTIFFSGLDVVVVDQVRISILNADQSVTLSESFIDTYFVYGDPSAVPVPAAVWLFGTGILGLIGLSRRRKTAPT